MQRSTDGASRAEAQPQPQYSESLDAAVNVTKAAATKGAEYGSKGLAMGKKHMRNAQAKAAERRASSVSSSAGSSTAPSAAAISPARPPPTNPELGADGDDYAFTARY